MTDRFRRLPPRIEPLYETEDVSTPPSSLEVRETSGLTPAGQVAGFGQLADAIARRGDRAGRASSSDPTRRRRLGVLLGALAIGMLTAAVMAWIG